MLTNACKAVTYLLFLIVLAAIPSAKATTVPVGTCGTDSTANLQATIATAAATDGLVYFPAGCYDITSIDATNLNDIRFEGEGNRSQIRVAGRDAAENWFDLSGSKNISFRNLSVVHKDGADIPRFLFLWACTGAGNSCSASGYLNGLGFERVNIDAKSNTGFLYAYGFGTVGGGQSGDLTCRDSTWIQRHNGPNYAATPYARNALVHLNTSNSLAVTSAHVTVSTTLSISWGGNFNNCNFIDNPASFAGTANYTYNASIVLYGVAGFTSNSGSYQCMCDAPIIIWADTQGAYFNSPMLLASDGGSGRVYYWVLIGGGINSYIKFDGAFWSSPRYKFIAVDKAASSTNGGVWNLRVVSNNLGGNDFNVPFIGLSWAGCGPFSVGNEWYKVSYFDLLDGGNNIESCGSIDNSTIFQNPGWFSLPPGATNYSRQF